MKTEISAGGIVVYHNRVLLLRDMSDSWTFPKGMVEESETYSEAAMREIKEEVGLTKLKFVASLSPIEYIFRRGRAIHKTVHYFLFKETVKEKIVCQKSEGIKEAKWFAFDNAFLSIGYKKTNIPILQQAKTLL